MSKYVCIGKSRDKQGRITAYTVMGEDRRQYRLTPVALKQLIKLRKVTVTNLTLTKDNRLVGRKGEGEAVSTTGTTSSLEGYSPSGIGNKKVPHVVGADIPIPAESPRSKTVEYPASIEDAIEVFCKTVNDKASYAIENVRRDINLTSVPGPIELRYGADFASRGGSIAGQIGYEGRITIIRQSGAKADRTLLGVCVKCSKPNDQDDQTASDFEAEWHDLTLGDPADEEVIRMVCSGLAHCYGTIIDHYKWSFESRTWAEPWLARMPVVRTEGRPMAPETFNSKLKGIIKGYAASVSGHVVRESDISMTGNTGVGGGRRRIRATVLLGSSKNQGNDTVYLVVDVKQRPNKEYAVLKTTLRIDSDHVETSFEYEVEPGFDRCVKENTIQHRLYTVESLVEISAVLTLDLANVVCGIPSKE